MVKKRLLYGLYPFIFLLVLPVVFASAEETIYSGTVKSGETIEAKGYTFSVRVIANFGAYIQYEGSSITVRQGECEWYGNLRFCVGTPAYSYRNSTTWEDIYQVNVNMVIRSGFDINKTVDKAKMIIGEKTNVRVRLLNDGAFDITNIDFRDAYPPELEVRGVEGCFLSDNGVEWHGTLGPGAELKCSYDLLAVDGVEYVSQAEVIYYDGAQKQKTSSGKLKIRVQNHSLKVTPSINITTPGINGTIEVGLTLENIYSGTISVSAFDITVPRSLAIIKSSGELSNKLQHLSWEGDMKHEEKKNFTFTLQPRMSGNFTLDMVESYKVENFGRNFKKQINLIVDCDCLQVQHKISRKDGKAHVLVQIYNPSTRNTFYNVGVGVSGSMSDFVSFTRSFPFVVPGETVALLSKDIDISRGGFYLYDVAVEYDSVFDQHFKEEKSVSAQYVTEKAENGTTPVNDTVDTVLADSEITESEPSNLSAEAAENETEKILLDETAAYETKTGDKKLVIILSAIMLFSLGVSIVLKRRLA